MWRSRRLPTVTCVVLPTPTGTRPLTSLEPAAGDDPLGGVIARAVACREVVDGRERQRVAGRPSFGPRGFGHSRDRSAVVEGEAAAIRQAAQRVLSGETLSQIVADWNEVGLRTTTG